MNDVLQKLAQELHVPIAVLWAALVGQARITAWFYGVWAVLGAAGVVSGVAAIRHGFKIRPTSPRADYGTSSYFERESLVEQSLWYRYLGGVTVFVCLLIGERAAYWCITALLNPEYWALSKILDRLSP